MNTMSKIVRMLAFRARLFVTNAYRRLAQTISEAVRYAFIFDSDNSAKDGLS